MKLIMRPLMTKYEFCQLCADSYRAKGNLELSESYTQLMLNMTLEEARRPL